MKKLIAGNWKMNGLLAARAEVETLAKDEGKDSAGPEILICPPATLLRSLIPSVQGTAIQLGGQCCHPKASGAHTGDISAEMLKDAGANFVLCGHSERRTDHRESSAEVASQAEAAWRAGLIAIICVGESAEQRRANQTERVLAEQIDESVPKSATGENSVVAYEPIWAIGTGLTASNTDIETAHSFIRKRLIALLGQPASTIRLLYGGSVKPSNAKEILNTRDVDGVLVGGASLKAADFGAIINAAR